MSDQHSIAKKIKAILAKADSSTFEGETAAFLAKAQALMDEHGIDLATVATSDDPIGGKNDESVRVANAWQRKLFAWVAKLYYCNIVLFTERGKAGCDIGVYGKASSRAMVREMWPYILKSVGRKTTDLVIEQTRDYDRVYDLYRKAGHSPAQTVREIGKPPTRDKTRQQIGIALCVRISEIIDARPKEEATLSDGRALVLVDQVQAYIDEEFGKLDSIKSRAQTYTPAALAAANGINLDAQVTGNGGGQKLLS